MSDLKIGIIVGTTRPGRKSLDVANWVKNNAKAAGVDFDIVDIADYDLPLLDEPVPGGAENDHTKKWAAVIDQFDGYIFVTGEYNHTIPAALTNAIAYLNREWNDKAAGIVSYGSMGGVRANEHLRQVLAELQVADVRQNVMLSLFTDFENFSLCKPVAAHLTELETQVAQIARWARALKPLREQQQAAAA
ncbi:MAG: NAD(P)H-dependent oxidoreductase [Cryobacterium sp.]|nr:NAD(P)H-dependent oxidoreductase [Cryobacterium sp.]